jgi:hypothetical protein
MSKLNSSTIPPDKNLTAVSQSSRVPADHAGTKWVPKTTSPGLRDTLLQWLARWPLMFGFLYELRSFRYRMGEVRRLRLYALDHPEPNLPQWTRTDIPEEQCGRAILTSIWDMQRAAEGQRWVALTDERIFLLGWDKGGVWRLSEIHSQDFCSKAEASKLDS